MKEKESKGFEEKAPNAFCEGNNPCTMNYCDENGCLESKRRKEHHKASKDAQETKKG